ncbi:MAG: RNA-binding transcriptional accessory protein [Erysipelotrichaceae bacterium]|nr:RNA-binding transcriptional accessory protein [Erysipelotrichaceae bacterium]
MEIIKIIAKEFNVKENQVSAVFNLLDEGNTIPFIARYRKEAHGALDDKLLRDIFERREYLNNFFERRETIINSITEQEKMTPEIHSALLKATTLAELEDIYRPYRPKRKTRASIAKAKGLEPLAVYIMEQKEKTPLEEVAATYIDEEKDVKTIEDALQGAYDIIAEDIADNAEYRGYLRKKMYNEGRINTSLIGEDPRGIYKMYYDYNEPIRNVADHRLLAIRRGDKQGVLKVVITLPEDEVKRFIASSVIKENSPFEEQLSNVIDDAYKRLMVGPTETEIRNDRLDIAEDNSMRVFQENLKQLLLTAPLKEKVVLGFDPAYRTGCKLAVLDKTGKVLETAVIYPHQPRNQVVQSEKVLENLYKKYKYDYIAIGNGTASRESDIFVKNFIEKTNYPINSLIISEAGASVYSASDIGREEFPDFEVEERSAVSIGRRLQDPLAELVKIDPKAIGVGQYQHDMNQKKLGERLGAVVEDTVNQVGVDLNNASPSLLSYVSGISIGQAKSIVNYRNENGPYNSRDELLKVPSLGPKTFEQAAGFLRIRDNNPLDNTGVHPESYDAAHGLLKELKLDVSEIGSPRMEMAFSLLNEIQKEQLAEKLDVGLLTLEDILADLARPGRDPRDEAVSAELRHDITNIKDLKEGMVLKGTVRNIMDFGAFVDIGVEENGLIHISELSKKFIKHPLDVVSINQIVEVKIIGVDLERKRISLSMKQV